MILDLLCSKFIPLFSLLKEKKKKKKEKTESQKVADYVHTHTDISFSELPVLFRRKYNCPCMSEGISKYCKI